MNPRLLFSVMSWVLTARLHLLSLVYEFAFQWETPYIPSAPQTLLMIRPQD